MTDGAGNRPVPVAPSALISPLSTISPTATEAALGLALWFIAYRYKICRVIKSFRNSDTSALYSGRCPRRWRAIRKQAERKHAMLDAAATFEFLSAPPGNRLEKLTGKRAGQWSIRINDRWQVCFRWEDGDAWDVEIVDCH